MISILASAMDTQKSSGSLPVNSKRSFIAASFAANGLTLLNDAIEDGLMMLLT